MISIRKWLCMSLVGVLAGLTGCGAGSGNGTQFTTPATSPVSVVVSDAAADSILSLEFTVNSIVLTTTSSSTVSLLPSPSTIEFSHLSATAEPISEVTVPEGTYTSATIMVSNAQVTFVNSSGQVVTQSFTGTASATINFNPPIVIGTSPVTLNFDLNLAQSITIVGNNLSINPVITGVLNALPAANQQEEDNGAMRDLTGTVTAAPGTNSFQLAVLPQLPQTLTIFVNGATQFEGITGLSGLAANMIVEVDAVMQGDGSLLATRVEAEIEGTVTVKQEAEGLVTSVNGVAKTFQVVVQEAVGSGAPSLGSTLTVNVDTSTTSTATQFVVPSGLANLNGLPFTASFASFNNLVIGQRVEAETLTTFAGTADKVKLDLQTFSGIVGPTTPLGANQQSFVLNLPAESALRLLTGVTDIDVIQQPDTELKGLSTVLIGNGVRARGLLFFDTVSHRYKLVASRITTP